MSLINDALNKVQQQRGQNVSARAVVRYGSSRQPTAQPQAPARTPPYIWVLVNVGVLILVLAGNHFFFNEAPLTSAQSSMISPASETAAIEPKSAADPIFTQPSPEIRVTPAPETASPFLSSPAPASDQPPYADDYDLAGMTVVGKNTLLSIVRRSDQRSFWIPVGKTVGEVTAVSYNPDNDDARIRVRGRLVTIVMRNAAPATN